jgi:hypothetical protein
MVADLEIITKTAFICDAWIHQHTPRVESEIVKANLVAADSEILNEIATKVDAWIRQRAQHLLTQKSSKKLLPQVTCGFVTAHSPN